MKRVLAILSLLYLIASQAEAQQKTDSTRALPDTSKPKPPRPDLFRKIPQPVGWINDYAFLFTNDQVRQLDSIVTKYEKETTGEIGVLTLEANRTNQKDFDEFTLLIAYTWGVGKKDTNNGILIVIAPHLRRIKIHNGLGIEKVLSNEKTQEIIDKVIIPYFHDDKYFEGTKQGILALIKALPPKN